MLIHKTENKYNSSWNHNPYFSWFSTRLGPSQIECARERTSQTLDKAEKLLRPLDHMTQRNRYTERLVLGDRKIIPEESNNVKAQVEPAATVHSPGLPWLHTVTNAIQARDLAQQTNFIRFWNLFFHQVLLIFRTSISHTICQEVAPKKKANN